MNYDSLKLENQLCFPLYACAKEVVKLYKPYLEPLGLTYTQYITMMVLWEREVITSKELGTLLYLDSGTFTPVLKKLEAKGYVRRERSKEDERNLTVRLTEQGKTLRDRAASVPAQVGGCVKLEPQEAGELYRLLYKVLAGVSEKKRMSFALLPFSFLSDLYRSPTRCLAISQGRLLTCFSFCGIVHVAF